MSRATLACLLPLQRLTFFSFELGDFSLHSFSNPSLIPDPTEIPQTLLSHRPLPTTPLLSSSPSPKKNKTTTSSQPPAPRAPKLHESINRQHAQPRRQGLLRPHRARDRRPRQNDARQQRQLDAVGLAFLHAPAAESVLPSRQLASDGERDEKGEGGRKKEEEGNGRGEVGLRGGREKGRRGEEGTDESSDGEAGGDGGDGARADVTGQTAARGEGGEDVGWGVVALWR